MHTHRFTQISARFTAVFFASLLFIAPNFSQNELFFEQYCPFGISDFSHLCEEQEATGDCEILDYRTINGSCNNINFPSYGQGETPMGRLFPAIYQEDGSTITNNRNNPRVISNILHDQTEDILSAAGLSAMVYTWLQFIDHDITIIPTGTEILEIPIPQGDPYFDPQSSGDKTIPVKRSKAVSGTGTSLDNPRQQENILTSWIDASSVYGSDDERAAWLRTHSDGKLKSSPSPNGDLLPCNTFSGNCADAIDPDAPEMDGNHDRCGNLVKVFVAGDVRASEQPGLTALHTLFVREHNRICDVLVSTGSLNDEENYQFARAAVIAKIQVITYNEVLPALGISLPEYQGYNADIDPSIFHEFASAAYRLGHTMVASTIPFMDENCSDMTLQSGCDANGVFGGTDCLENCKFEEITAPVPLRNSFFNPSLVANNGIDGLLRGLTKQQQQEIDPFVINDLRNFLFGQPGLGGLDLVALNIQRGRDHGLQDYASVRAALGLGRITQFTEINSNETIAQKLESAFGSVDRIDLWSGLVSEEHLPGKSVGITLHALLVDQFTRLRDGDRFWYSINPKFNFFYKLYLGNANLAKVIADNTGVLNLDNVFYYKDCTEVYCDASGKSSADEWIKKVTLGSMCNNSGNDNGYGDYTNMCADVKKGDFAYLSVKTGYKGSQFPENWNVWIDFNQDNIYDQDTELVMSGNAYSKLTRWIRIPSNAILGETRMRVAMSPDASPDPCGQFNKGEVEDYCVNITSWDWRSASTEGSETVAEQEIFGTEGMVVFPNPVTDKFTFVFNAPVSGEATATLFNTFGRTVRTMQFEARAGENLQEMYVNDLPPGSYVLLLDRGPKTGKIRQLVQVVGL